MKENRTIWLSAVNMQMTSNVRKKWRSAKAANSGAYPSVVPSHYLSALCKGRMLRCAWLHQERAPMLLIAQGL